MAILKSEDQDAPSSVDVTPLGPPGSPGDGNVWQSAGIVLISGRHRLALPAAAEEREFCVLCRKPLDEVAKLRALLMEVVAGGHDKVLFEPQEPSFELSVEKTPEGGFKVEVWMDASNAATGFYAWNAAGIRLYTTQDRLLSFVEDLAREFVEVPAETEPEKPSHDRTSSS